MHNQVSAHISKLQESWASGGFAITVQPPLPLSADVSNFVEQLAAHAASFDAVLVAEPPAGAVTLSCMALAVLLKRKGIEAIVQISGRDRNRLALQSDLLGLSALGLANLLVDMRPLSRASLRQNAGARLVADLDGAALLATAVRMRDEARFISGARIKTPPVLYTGALISLAESIQPEALSGAQFIVTAPLPDTRSCAAALGALESADPAFLRARPLLVSLPLLTDSSDARATGIEQVASAIEQLREFDAIRGYNIVVAQADDLPLAGQVVREVREGCRPPGGVRGVPRKSPSI